MRLGNLFLREGISLICFISVGIVSAQIDAEFSESEPQEVTISVGDTLVLGEPKSTTVFAFIDIFKKTRWDPDPLPDDAFTRKYKTYDSSTGNGFYRFFFRGDFDAAELPASFQGSKFAIKGLEVVRKEKDGSPMNVIYLETGKSESVIMVDIDNAANYGEISNVIFLNKSDRRP